MAVHSYHTECAIPLKNAGSPDSRVALTVVPFVETDWPLTTNLFAKLSLAACPNPIPIEAAKKNTARMERSCFILNENRGDFWGMIPVNSRASHARRVKDTQAAQYNCPRRCGHRSLRIQSCCIGLFGLSGTR